MADANMTDSIATASREAQPRLAFSSIRTTINEPPASSPPKLSYPAIAPYTSEVDPLDQSINLPSNYAALDQATQTASLLTATYHLLTSQTHSAALAAHTTDQQYVAAALITAHARSLRYLDALNRVHKAKRDLAGYVDARAPGGRCTGEWRLGEAEGLVAEVARWCGVARGLRGEGDGVRGVNEAPAGFGAAVLRMGDCGGSGGGSSGNSPPVGSLEMEMAKEFLERAGQLGGGGGAAAGGVGGVGGTRGACGAPDVATVAVGAGGKAMDDGEVMQMTDYGHFTPRETASRRSVSDQGGSVRAPAAAKDETVVGVREIGRIIGEIDEDGLTVKEGAGVAAGGSQSAGMDGKKREAMPEDVEMAGVENQAGLPRAGGMRKEGKKRKAVDLGMEKGEAKANKNKNKWAKAFGDMLL